MGHYVTADEDGITKVFEQLTAAGVLSRTNHECCSTCACASLGTAVEQEPEKYHGFAFYHAQDDECVREGGDLYIGFSSAKNDDDEGTVAVGLEVAKALQDAGFTIEWDGSAAHRIRVKDLDFEDYEKCDECGFKIEDCECCWTCNTYPCECCDECGQSPDDCRCDERCDECYELPEDCHCQEDEDEDD